MRLSILILSTVLATAARAQNASSEFARLQRLTGDWQATVGTKARIVHLNFRPVSNGSAVVETFTSNGRETLTIFHPDGDRLLATHYCAQGNQPRLALDPGGSSMKMIFRFVDATNLKTGADSHLIRLTIELRDDDHFDMTEVYISRGDEEVTPYRFTRVR